MEPLLTRARIASAFSLTSSYDQRSKAYSIESRSRSRKSGLTSVSKLTSWPAFVFTGTPFDFLAKIQPQIVAYATTCRLYCTNESLGRGDMDGRAVKDGTTHAIRSLHRRRRHDGSDHGQDSHRGRAHPGDGRGRAQGRGDRSRCLRHRRAPQRAVRSVLADHDARLYRCQDRTPAALDRD